MGSADRSRIIQSFVARIWLERAAGEHPMWRGHIHHIQGGEEAYFQDLSEVGEFLEQVSGVPGPALAGQGKPAHGVKRKPGK